MTAMVQFGMNVNLAAVAGGPPLQDTAFDLIQWAEARSRTQELILAAIDDNPTNARLAEFAAAYGVAPSLPSAGQLQQIVVRAAGFQNPDQWIERMAESLLPVCRVEIPAATGIGTGFLVGPTTLITAYHVIEEVIEGKQPAKDVVFRFDYRTNRKGVTVRQGNEYKLAGPFNRWKPADASIAAELDYALVKLDGTPGKDQTSKSPNSPARGWLKPKAYQFQKNEPLVIIQHPQARPLALAFNSVLGKAANYRINHNVNTEPGSSGSPCFNASWELVALHDWGSVSKNRAVSFSAILDRMRKKKTLSLVGS
jgi:V8-like Glu-specific endopeptidase